MEQVIRRLAHVGLDCFEEIGFLFCKDVREAFVF